MRQSSFQRVDIPLSRDIVSEYDDIVVVRENIEDIKSLANAIGDGSFDSIDDNIDDILLVANQVVPNLAEILMADDNAIASAASATESQLKAWQAEAERMTADSYATEPHNMFVKLYTSNGNGTFSSTNTMEYSSLHWATESGNVLAEGIIDDVTPSTLTVYSSSKTQELHNIQAQIIANMATAQGEMIGTGSPVLVLTTSEQNLPITVLIPSTDNNVFEYNDTNNTVTFKINASFNFKSSWAIALATGVTRTMTVRGRNSLDNSLVYERSVTINGTSGDIISLESTQLVTVGKNGIPESPLTIYWTIQADGVGLTVNSLISLLTSSSSYDLTTEASGITVIPVGSIASTNVQAALQELDTEKAALAYMPSGNIEATTIHGAINELDIEKLDKTGGTMTGAITALRETRVVMGANDIDLALGNVFIKTISGATTFTISNVLSTGNVNSFTLRLTNGGSSAITWFGGVRWSGGSAPTLTASGVDRISFESDDGGITWEQTGILKDIK